MYLHVEVDWRYGVDPRIVEVIDANNVPEELVHVISETEVIILNNPR